MKRLKPYDIVLLAPPLWRSDTRQIACEIVAVDGNEAALEPLDREDLARLPVVLPDMFMTFTHEGMLVALKGDLLLKSSFKVDKDASEASDLRFRVTDGVHSPARDGSRLPLCAPVTLTPTDDENGTSAAGVAPVLTQTIHLSADRILVEPLGESAPAGSLVRVELTLPGSDYPVTAVAAVLGTEAEGTLLQYRQITRAQRGRLVTFIFDCHREALKLYKAELRMARI